MKKCTKSNYLNLNFVSFHSTLSLTTWKETSIKITFLVMYLKIDEIHCNTFCNKDYLKEVPFSCFCFWKNLLLIC